MELSKEESYDRCYHHPSTETKDWEVRLVVKSWSLFEVYIHSKPWNKKYKKHRDNRSIDDVLCFGSTMYFGYDICDEKHHRHKEDTNRHMEDVKKCIAKKRVCQHAIVEKEWHHSIEDEDKGPENYIETRSEPIWWYDFHHFDTERIGSNKWSDKESDQDIGFSFLRHKESLRSEKVESFISSSNLQNI